MFLTETEIKTLDYTDYGVPYVRINFSGVDSRTLDLPGYGIPWFGTETGTIITTPFKPIIMSIMEVESYG